MTDITVLEIASHFDFYGEFIDAHPYGFGHINDTYAARFRLPDGSTIRYLLQRINHNVFKNPPALMENISGVTRHLRQKIFLAGGDPNRETLNVIPTKSGQPYHLTDDGNYWRAYIFIEQARTYESVEDLHHVYSAAQTIGRFQSMVADYPIHELHETIPDFHNTPKRLATFRQAVEDDVVNRAHLCQDDIQFVESHADKTSLLLDLCAAGAVPLRVTHNDTKLNNVMIDEMTGEGVCVIDLDTVMPGISLYDFGDFIRTGANTAAEDERDLTRVHVNLEVFERFTQGYLETAASSLNATEIDNLPVSALIITLENSIRFLTDFLNGDTYYKIHREGHNLDRARTQFKLVTELEAKLDEMMVIVNKYR